MPAVIDVDRKRALVLLTKLTEDPESEIKNVVDLASASVKLAREDDQCMHFGSAWVYNLTKRPNGPARFDIRRVRAFERLVNGTISEQIEPPSSRSEIELIIFALKMALIGAACTIALYILFLIIDLQHVGYSLYSATAYAITAPVISLYFGRQFGRKLKHQYAPKDILALSALHAYAVVSLMYASNFFVPFLNDTVIIDDFFGVTIINNEFDSSLLHTLTVILVAILRYATALLGFAMGIYWSTANRLSFNQPEQKWILIAFTVTTLCLLGFDGLAGLRSSAPVSTQ